jgi:hypothetical protein
MRSRFDPVGKILNPSSPELIGANQRRSHLLTIWQIFGPTSTTFEAMLHMLNALIPARAFPPKNSQRNYWPRDLPASFTQAFATQSVRASSAFAQHSSQTFAKIERLPSHLPSATPTQRSASRFLGKSQQELIPGKKCIVRPLHYVG